jgi:hypothetical protein
VSLAPETDEYPQRESSPTFIDFDVSIPFPIHSFASHDEVQPTTMQPPVVPVPKRLCKSGCTTSPCEIGSCSTLQKPLLRTCIAETPVGILTRTTATAEAMHACFRMASSKPKTWGSDVETTSLKSRQPPQQQPVVLSKTLCPPLHFSACATLSCRSSIEESYCRMVGMRDTFGPHGGATAATRAGVSHCLSSISGSHEWKFCTWYVMLCNGRTEPGDAALSGRLRRDDSGVIDLSNCMRHLILKPQR